MGRPLRVAFSGSGFKLPAHIGALLAIRDAGFKPIEYAGTSGGSIVAALAASGMDLDAMREIALSHNWSPMLHWSPTAIFSGGFCDGINLQTLMQNYTQSKTFQDISVPLTIVASDVSSETSYIFSSGTTPQMLLATATRSSASIPLVYSPVAIGSALLMDGGMCDNLPADLLIDDNVPRIGIQLISTGTPFNAANHSLFNVVPRLLDLILTATENAHVALAAKSGATFITVETGFAGCLDTNMSFEMRHRLMDAGYEATMATLKTL